MQKERNLLGFGLYIKTAHQNAEYVGRYDSYYFRGCVVGCRPVDIESPAGSHQVRGSEHSRFGGCRIL